MAVNSLSLETITTSSSAAIVASINFTTTHQTNVASAIACATASQISLFDRPSYPTRLSVVTTKYTPADGYPTLSTASLQKSNTNNASPSQSPAELPQSISNGDTLLGTLDSPTYPQFLGASYPWGQDRADNVDPYHNSPSTGVTRYFDFTISDAVIYPDGYKKSVMLVNNQFPGPMLEANWGDTVSVTVHNNLTGESPQQTALHWHGVLQHNTNWYDGSPGLGQCPIAPGDSLTYEWKAELYGSSWYHAHLSAHWPQGIFGPMLIYGPEHVAYDVDLGPVFLSDWYHQSAEVIIRQLLEPKDQYVDIPADNNLINGKNPLPCSTTDNNICKPGASYAKFKFEAGKTHKLRLINSGAQAVQKFSIDGHKLRVIANDFVPVQPYDTNVVTLGVGQRSDVIVVADQDARQSYWMRSNATCANNNNPNARAIVYYNSGDSNSHDHHHHHDNHNGDDDGDDDDDSHDGHGSDSHVGSGHTTSTTSAFSSIPTTLPPNDDTVGRNLPCTNDPLEMTEPVYKMRVQSPSITQVFKIEFRQNSTGSWVWFMNNNSYLSDFSNPTLNLLSDYNQSYLTTETRRNPYYIPDNAQTYRFIVQNETPSPHPIHHHGHNSYVLYVSDQPWNDDEATRLESRIVRRGNPQRRDVQQVPGGGYLVLQFDADNPGAWGFHCHMAFHIGGGFFTETIEGTNKLLGKAVPRDILEGCTKYDAWNRANLPLAKVYDSGQKV